MRKTKPFLLLIFLLCSFYGKAQEEFIEPPSRLLSRFSFKQLTGGVVLLHARLDDYPDTLNFILDTGSSGISLDSSTLVYLGIEPTKTNRTIRGIAGIKKVDFLFNRKLHFPGLAVDSLNFHVNDYSLLSSVYGYPIDGIIGYSLLSRYIVKINYDSLQIDICSQGTLRYPKGGYILKPILNTLPIQTARIKDDRVVNARFLHDIGAGACLMLTQDFIEDSTLLKRKRKLFPKEAQGVGGEIKMNLTVVRELRFGPYRFRNVPTYVFDDAYNVTSYPYMGGLIGNDIFRRFNVILNYAKRDIHLLPNSHFKDPFDYTYSGMELFFIEGKTIVGAVSKNSPAEKSGILEGDEIIGVDNLINGDFNTYKSKLLSVTGTCKILISREGELVQLKMKVISIL